MKKNRVIFLFIPILLLITCCSFGNRKADSSEQRTDTFKTEEKSSILSVEKNKDREPIEECLALMMQLLVSSSIKNPFIEHFDLVIEEVERNRITVKLIDTSNKDKNVVGWVVFDISKKEISDITYDIQDPIKLKYDADLWLQLVTCLEHSVIANDMEINKTEDRSVDFFENTSFEEVYQLTKQQKDVSDSHLLLPHLPHDDIRIDIKDKGLLSISYKIDSAKIEIEFLYEGGITSLTLYKVDKGVKRIIIHSPD